jgi:predicted RNase H-like HicB family nuclease
MLGTLIVVKAAWDPDARVWWVEHSDLPGLNLEAETLEELRDKLPGAVADLFEAAGDTERREVPIELIAHAHTRVHLGCAA